MIRLTYGVELALRLMCELTRTRPLSQDLFDREISHEERSNLDTNNNQSRFCHIRVGKSLQSPSSLLQSSLQKGERLLAKYTIIPRTRVLHLHGVSASFGVAMSKPLKTNRTLNET